MKKDITNRHFATEEEFNNILEEFWRAEGNVPEILVMTKEQEERLRSFQPEYLEDWETGEPLPNPVKQRIQLKNTINLYSSQFGETRVEVKN